MKLDIVHDYEGFPYTEAENTVEAATDNGYRHIKTFYEQKNVGTDTLYLAAILLEEEN